MPDANAVLLGAGIAAGATLITALLTAALAQRRETRARLFDVRRAAYTEALRTVSVAQHVLTNPPDPHAGFAPIDMSKTVAELELLGSPKVHGIFVVLWSQIDDAMSDRMQLPDDADALAWQELRGSPAMEEHLARMNTTQSALIAFMRRDLGGKDLYVSPGAFNERQGSPIASVPGGDGTPGAEQPKS